MSRDSFSGRMVGTFAVLFMCIIGLVYGTMYFWQNRSSIAIEVAELAEDVALPFRIAELQTRPRDQELLIPIRGLTPEEISDTWGAARSNGRSHEGADIFAPRGTPVFSATDGYVVRVGVGDLGGNFVFVVGAGGIRYYYAHLDRIAQGIERGEHVTTDTVLGFVGNTGNAAETPPHLHFGVYGVGGAENPYPLLRARPYSR